jgi:MoaA/NifB/PqqE/SkfB family radical SAM enzyme
MKSNWNRLHLSMRDAEREQLSREIHFIPMKKNYMQIADILEYAEIFEMDRVSILKFVPQGRGKDNKDDLLMNNEDYK